MARYEAPRIYPGDFLRAERRAGQVRPSCDRSCLEGLLNEYLDAR